MSGPTLAGLFIYAKDLVRLADFYEAVLGMSRLHTGQGLVVLGSPDMQLVLHAIPPDIAASVVVANPPVKRENTALKFFFAVPGIAPARATATAFGGEVLPESWGGPGFRACNAVDPEGNIFQLRETVA